MADETYRGGGTDYSRQTVVPKSMQPRARVLTALLVAIVVVGAATAAEFWPRQVSCPSGQSGGMEIGNGGASGGYNNSRPGYGGTGSISVPVGGAIEYSWSTTNGSVTTFVVLDGSFHELASDTAASGSGRVTATDTEILFAVPPGPPPVTVDISWSCTQTVEGP